MFSLEGEDLHFWVSGFLELEYMCTFNLIWGKGVYIANIVLSERVQFDVHYISFLTSSNQFWHSIFPGDSLHSSVVLSQLSIRLRATWRTPIGKLS